MGFTGIHQPGANRQVECGIVVVYQSFASGIEEFIVLVFLVVTPRVSVILPFSFRVFCCVPAVSFRGEASTMCLSLIV